MWIIFLKPDTLSFSLLNLNNVIWFHYYKNWWKKMQTIKTPARENMSTEKKEIKCKLQQCLYAGKR